MICGELIIKTVELKELKFKLLEAKIDDKLNFARLVSNTCIIIN